MTEPLLIKVFENQQLVYSGEFEDSVEIGRQGEGEDEPYSEKKSASGPRRLIIALREEDTISRRHLQIDRLPEGRIRVRNLRDRMPIRLQDNRELQPRMVCEVHLPFVLLLGRKMIRILDTDDNVSLQGLAEATRPPGHPLEASSRFGTFPLPTGIEMDSVVRWLKGTMDVVHSATHSSDFFEQAALAAVDLVGLDACRVLVLEKEAWKVQCLRTAAHVAGELNWHPSRLVLDKLRAEKKTFWQMPSQSVPHSPSFMGVRTVVAAPILAPSGEVIGTLYGDRRLDSLATAPITKVEAMLVELLACGVAAGLARVTQEKAALTARVRFEQFFTPELSRHLTSNPDLLKGKDAEVSLLFCDIRGFSRISERLGPAKTVEWIGAVMGALSDGVLAHSGVLVDYIGDELVAMWGAPEEQPAHARLACQAALEMLDILPNLSQQWQSQIGEPIALGIGINSGVARVGNTGSHHKFKYGPLGNTVNLASRVEGVTKYLKVHFLVTGATHAQLDPNLPSRRIGQVRVINIAEPVDLYEMFASRCPDWQVLKERYEKALAEFEKREFRGAASILADLLVKHPGDGPSLVLLSRTVHYLVEESTTFDPVWELPGK